MDDWVVLAPTRWKLRKVIRVVNETLAELKVEQHPDKTLIGRVSHGFDFLGYRFGSEGLIGVARPTIERFVERATRLYEQGADVDRIGEYVRRWLRWVTSFLRGMASYEAAQNVTIIVRLWHRICPQPSISGDFAVILAKQQTSLSR